ncbi:MAG: hypothetical protein WAM14_24380, partial [Candidatus Nitrosopolaris sp.]
MRRFDTGLLRGGVLYILLFLLLSFFHLLVIADINIVINVRAETKDIHILCTELDKDIVTIIRYALKRMKIENF